MIIDSN